MSDDEIGGLAASFAGLVVIGVIAAAVVLVVASGVVAWVVWQCIRHIAAWVRSTPEWQEHELRQHATQAHHKLNAVERHAIAGITARTQDALDRFQSEVQAAQRDAVYAAPRR